MLLRRTLILGGGFGGVAAAHELRRLRPDDEIILIDRAAHFMVGFRKTWILLGDGRPDAARGALANLQNAGIQFTQGEVTAIYPAQRAADVDGQRYEADAVIVALGARLAVEQVPGFQAHVWNVYDAEGLEGVRRQLEQFKGGRVSVGVYGLPYKCPPAPYEIAIMAAEWFHARGVTVEMELFTPLPATLPIVGSAGCGVIEEHLAKHGIRFLPGHQATAVEDQTVFFGQQQRQYDLLLGVPPHRCPHVVVSSGLAQEDGWIQVDSRTLETIFPGVYAVGDVTMVTMANGMPLPMAGVFAEGEGRVAAQRIAAALDGREPEATFDGAGGCFLEVGEGQARMVEGDFLALEGPEVTLSAASREYLADKQRFEQERLQAWFGEGARD